MIISKLSYLKIAMCDLWKVMIFDHVEAESHAMQDFESKQVIVTNAEQTSH